ncbi:unnamed protein product [Prorocentrum cordatum]|uniref:Uncharacterized protein n=1 Tax=Prorocentrum cordatum TaxID=2364126 RepID=A0ABN9WHD2_9DINO|nr:unnamed protein product [Polarella glacialis]
MMDSSRLVPLAEAVHDSLVDGSHPQLLRVAQGAATALDVPAADAALAAFQVLAPLALQWTLDARRGGGAGADDGGPSPRREPCLRALARLLSGERPSVSGWLCLGSFAAALAACDVRRSRGCLTWCSVCATLRMLLRCCCRPSLERQQQSLRWTPVHLLLLHVCACGILCARCSGAVPRGLEEKDFHVALYCLCALLYWQVDARDPASLEPARWGMLQGKDACDSPCDVCYVHHQGDGGSEPGAATARVLELLRPHLGGDGGEVNVKCFLAVGCAKETSQVCWPWAEDGEIGIGTSLRMSEETKVFKHSADRASEEQVCTVNRGDHLEAVGPAEKLDEHTFRIPVKRGRAIKLDTSRTNTRLQLNRHEQRQVQEMSDVCFRLLGIVAPLTAASLLAWAWSGPVAAALVLALALALNGPPPERPLVDWRAAWATYQRAIRKGEEVMHAATVVEVGSRCGDARQRVALRMEYNVLSEMLSEETCKCFPREGRHGNDCGAIVTIQGGKGVDSKFPRVVYQDVDASKYKLLDTVMSRAELESRLQSALTGMAVRGRSYNVCPDAGSINCMVYSMLPLLAMMPSNWNLCLFSQCLPALPTFELIQRVWSARALGARGQPDQPFPFGGEPGRNREGAGLFRRWQSFSEAPAPPEESPKPSPKAGGTFLRRLEGFAEARPPSEMPASSRFPRGLGADPWFAFCCWFPFALTHKFQAEGGSLSSRVGVGLHGLCLRVFEGLGFTVQRLIRGGQKRGGKKTYPWAYKDKIERMATSLMMCVWLFKAFTYVLVHRTGFSTLDLLQSRVNYSVLLVLATELFSRCVLCQFVRPAHELRSSLCCCCRHRTRKRSLGQQGSQDEGPPPAKRRRS